MHASVPALPVLRAVSAGGGVAGVPATLSLVVSHCRLFSTNIRLLHNLQSVAILCSGIVACGVVASCRGSPCVSLSQRCLSVI